MTRARTCAEGWVAAGAEVVEMEAATLLAVAARRGVAAAVLLAVSDQLADGGGGESTPRRWRRSGCAWARPACAALAGYCWESVTVRRSCARGTGSEPGRHGLAQRGEVAGDLVQPLPRCPRGPCGAGAAAAAARPVLEPVEGVLDALEALGDRAQPPRQPLDVGGRRDVQRAHRRLLRLHGLLAGLEGAGQRPVHHRVRDQLLGDLAERLLALAREAVDERLFALVGHRPRAYSNHGVRSRPTLLSSRG